MRVIECAERGDMKWKEDKRLEDEVVEEALHWRKRGAVWARLNSKDIQARGAQKVRHSASKCGTSRRRRDGAGRTAPEGRAA